MTGSHCDAIPLAGAYDGTLGVLGGIAALRALKDSGFAPRRPIDVVMFTSEEPTRFGLGCIGRSASIDKPVRLSDSKLATEVERFLRLGLCTMSGLGPQHM